MTTDDHRGAGSPEGMENGERAKRASPPERSAAIRQASDGVGGFAGAKPPEIINDEVARLVRLADANSSMGAPDEVRVARVRRAVHGVWRDEYVARRVMARRRWLLVALPLFAAASSVIAFALWRPAAIPAPVVVAHVDQIMGQASGSPAPVGAGGAVMSGSTVTTSDGTLAMTFTSGVHLRLDASTIVRVESATDVTIERGAVYVDSADAHPGPPGASPISIHTTSGIVRDIGTQFEVRLAGVGIRTRVRKGQVRVTDANGMEVRADAGEELLWRDGLERSITRRPIAVTGSEWAWAERAALAFNVDGQTLGAFLDWVGREGAWTVTFASETVSEAARTTVLHGRPDLLKGLTLAEALDVVLKTCGLRHRIDGLRVVIAPQLGAEATK